jgi:selenocysteine-specific elongation factor
MPRHLILGTAGHIDHGKTTLVRALTGVDTDRLPEEKARGITIDIGFARLDLGDYQLGVVDVPGHERFIKNMLAGATGIDLAMLLVAADDSVMPQTREHLEILQLLGIRHGVVVLSKCDLADPDWLELVHEEVRGLVAGSFLEQAPIVRTAANSGRGIDDLKQALRDVCSHIAQRQRSEHFRLPIDRSFAVQGYGTVVTGSVWSGELHVGDEVQWLPSGQSLRVRGLQNHESAANQVSRGQRAAINLTGVHHSEVVRGQELATTGFLHPTQCLTVRLHVLRSSPWPIKHRARLRLHVGTAERLATVALLEGNVVERTQWGLAQLFLDAPATATWGQPFVLRAESPMTTVGGGQVLQPAATRISRKQPERIEHLAPLWSDDKAARAATVLFFYGMNDWTDLDLCRDAGLSRDEIGPVLTGLAAAGVLIELPLSTRRTLRLHRDLIHEYETRVAHALDRLHAEFPLHAAIARHRLVARLDYLGDEQLVQAIVQRLLAARKLTGDDRYVAVAGFVPKLSPAEQRLRDQVIAAFEAAGFQPPSLDELSKKAVARGDAVGQIVDLCVAEGHLAQITSDLFLHAKWESELRRRVVEALHERPGLAVSDIRDLLDITRKYALPFCEYLDRVGCTRREGDLRVLATAAPSTAAGAATHANP